MQYEQDYTLLDNYFKNSSIVINSLRTNISKIEEIINIISKSQQHGGKLLICGNGGSSSDAEHFACELTCSFEDRCRKAFAAISLGNSISAMTAWSNDFNFNSFFARQVEAYANKEDILFLISTGGGSIDDSISLNLINAVNEARRLGILVVSIVGKDGGELFKLSDISIKVKSDRTSHIQEAHIAIIHAICMGLEVVNKNGRIR